MTNMAERPSGGIESEDPEGAAEAAGEIAPASDDASDVAPEGAAADSWSASTPEVQEWAAASDRAFGFDPSGEDVGADEAP